jgi:hypothetical protein
MANPFIDDLNSAACACALTRTTTSTRAGVGGGITTSYGVIIYDAERDDGEEVGAVTLSNPETVERLSPVEPIEEVRVADIAPSPYTFRRMDDADHEKFVKLTRECGHLLPYPNSAPGRRRRAA